MKKVFITWAKRESSEHSLFALRYFWVIGYACFKDFKTHNAKVLFLMRRLKWTA